MMLLAAMAACGNDQNAQDDAGSSVDAANPVDMPDASTTTIDADMGPDAPTQPACGNEQLPVAQITGTEGIAIAPDGTLYYSQDGAIGRRRPGMAPEDAWVALPGVGTVWGLAYDEASGVLYVAVPGSNNGKLMKIDTAAAAPTATVLYPGANGANGLVIGPDGALYYSAGSKVYRVDLQGQRTQVNGTQGVPGANGLFFASPTNLLVLAYNSGEVWELTLDASMHETARTKKVTVPNARLDGIARDEQGRWYLGDNGGGRLLRYRADWTGLETLLPNVPSAANVVFGRGALSCTDVYVASGDTLGRFVGDSGGTP